MEIKRSCVLRKSLNKLKRFFTAQIGFGSEVKEGIES